MSDSRAPRTWKILVADDNDDHALLIEMALERAAPMPISVSRAHNGDEAVDMIREEAPDLLLLDLNMPGKSGHEVLETVKGDDALRGIPVAVLTSSDRDEDIARSYGLGGNHFITKPGDPQELEQRLRSLLNNLSELTGIRRGTGGLQATGVSAMDQGSELFRKWLPAFAAIVVLGGLIAFAYFTGLIP